MPGLAEADQAVDRPSDPGESDGPVFLEDLYVELGRIAGIALPDSTIEGILKRLPNWTYGAENTPAGNLHFLHRTIMDNTVLVELPEPETQSGQVVRDKQGIKIRAGRITGGDLQYAIRLEDQLQPPETEQIIARKIRPKPNPEARRFQQAKKEFLREGDLFTERESVLFSHMTHCGDLAALGSAVGISASSASRITQAARQRLGLESNIDLMITAVAHGTASIEHVPEGMTSVLGEKDLELVADFYSPDETTREKARQAVAPQGDSRWSRMYDRLELAHDAAGATSPVIKRHETVLYALRDGVIELPDLSES